MNTSTDDRLVLDEDSYEITFTVLYVNEGDVGLYEMRLVDNGYSWFTVIDVQGKLINTTINCYVPVPDHYYSIITVSPIIFITTETTTLYNKGTITCQSKIVNPKLTFVWSKNGVVINTTNDGYQISSDYFKSYLTIQYYSSNPRDGVYNCTASNAAGTSTASTRVTVQGMSKQTLRLHTKLLNF